MAKRQFQLNDEQVKEIKRYERQSTRPSELRRLQAVRLYGTGHHLTAILDIVGCGESSIRTWATQYKQKGIEALLSHYHNSAQNARKLSLEQEKDLREKLRFYRPNQVLSQSECEGVGEFWSVTTVKAVVSEWYGVTYRDLGSYRNLLHRCGFSYQKAEQAYKSRPSEVKVADFEAELEKK